MARYFTAANSQRLRATGIALRQDTAITMAVWARRNTAAFQWLMKYYNSANTLHHHMIGLRDATAYRARSRGSSLATAETTGTIDDGKWHLVAGVFESTTRRLSYADGATSGADTGSVTTTGLQSISIGAQDDGGDPFDGALAEVAVWRAVLNASEMRMLASGFSALWVRPDKLAFYAPLWCTEDFDIIGGVTLPLVGSGSLGVQAHPRIVYPPGFEVRSVGRSVVNVPQILAGSRRKIRGLAATGILGEATLTCEASLTCGGQRIQKSGCSISSDSSAVCAASRIQKGGCSLLGEASLSCTSRRVQKTGCSLLEEFVVSCAGSRIRKGASSLLGEFTLFGQPEDEAIQGEATLVCESSFVCGGVRVANSGCQLVEEFTFSCAGRRVQYGAGSYPSESSLVCIGIRVVYGAATLICEAYVVCDVNVSYDVWMFDVTTHSELQTTYGAGTGIVQEYQTRTELEFSCER